MTVMGPSVDQNLVDEVFDIVLTKLKENDIHRDALKLAFGVKDYYKEWDVKLVKLKASIYELVKLEAWASF